MVNRLIIKVRGYLGNIVIKLGAISVKSDSGYHMRSFLPDYLQPSEYTFRGHHIQEDNATSSLC